MSEVKITLKENGPALVSGPIEMVDHQGNPVDLKGKQTIALCRCGVTEKRPFCDGKHKECGYIANETADQIG